MMAEHQVDDPQPTPRSYRIVLRIAHLVFSVFMAAFFIYAGIKKFIPKPLPSGPVNNSEFLRAFEANQFESPVTFKMSVKALRASGFLKMVGVLQILSGLLILIPRTRLGGLLLLLPLTVNIFCFHFFMDDRPGENVETGLLLLLNLCLVVYYSDQLRCLLVEKRSRLR